MKKSIAAIVVPFVMIGCGGSSNSNSANTGVGYYVDSAVEGVDYVCGSQRGTTDAQGKFTFEVGKECLFSLNNIVFKTVGASNLKNEKELQEDNIDVARFLQILDSDGNPDNGITISSEVAKAVEKIPSSDVDFSTLYTTLSHDVSGYSGKLVSRAQAQAHLDKTTPPGGGSTGRWDNVPVLSANGTNQLFVTSDADHLYLLLKSDANLSSAEFYLDTDNSALSGLKTGSWPNEGLDYKIDRDGMYHLKSAQDYSGEYVQAMSYTVADNALELALDKSKFDYLAENIAVTVLFPNDFSKNIPLTSTVTKYHDGFFDANQPDTVAPLFALTGANPLILNVGDSYIEPGVTATDVIDGAVTPQIDTSAVDTSKPGFYSVIYTASDSAGNNGHASRIVQVKGGAAATTLEIKNLGDFNDSVVINHQTGQVWSNDSRPEATTRGCYIFGEELPYTSLAGILHNFCEESDYAGFTDWRAPTPLEMSKFTVQMHQEGKTPGMARTGCTRTLGIESDNTTVKAVWTHNMAQPGLVETDTLTPAGGRCVRGPVDNSAGGFSIQEIGASKDKVMVDTSKNLMWVNETSFGACMAIHADKPEEYNTSKGFCAALDFAGAQDWKDPSSAQLQDFIVRTNQAHILPGYAAPCNALLARDANGSESSISTRYDTTQAVGTTIPLVVPLTANIGLRCVRSTN